MRFKVVTIVATSIIVAATGCDQDERQAQVLVLEGDKSFKQHKFTDAVKSWRASTKLYDKNPRVYNKLGQVTLHKLRGSAQQVSGYFEKAVELDPDNVEYQYQLGWVYSDTGEGAKAEALLKKVVNADSDHAMARFRLGKVFDDADKYEEARGMYEESIKRNPTIVDAYIRLGMLYDRYDYLDEGLAVVQNGLKNNSDSPELQNQLGGLLMRRERWNDAIAAYQKATELKNNYHKAIYGLGAAYFYAGNIPKAKDHLQRFARAAGKTDMPMVKEQAFGMLGKIEVLEKQLSKNPE
jgi:tetratricopeptide (TPR) repeat protein